MGAAEDQAEVLNSGPAGALRELNSAIESVQIALGESGLTEALTLFANNFADIVRSVSEFIRDEPALGTALAAVGVALVALTVAGGPITLLAAGLAGIIAFWPQISDAAETAIDVIEGAFDTVVEAVRSIVDNRLNSIYHSGEYGNHTISYHYKRCSDCFNNGIKCTFNYINCSFCCVTNLRPECNNTC